MKLNKWINWWDINLNRINYEKKISKKLNSYIKENVKLDLNKNEIPKKNENFI